MAKSSIITISFYFILMVANNVFIGFKKIAVLSINLTEFFSVLYISIVFLLVVVLATLIRLNNYAIKNIRCREKMKALGYFGKISIKQTTKGLLVNTLAAICIFLTIPSTISVATENLIFFWCLKLIMALLGGILYLTLNLHDKLKIELNIKLNSKESLD